MAHSKEQLQQEQSRKEQELKETRDAHQSQISSLQEKIANLVSIVGQSQKVFVCNAWFTRHWKVFHLFHLSVPFSHRLLQKLISFLVF